MSKYGGKTVTNNHIVSYFNWNCSIFFAFACKWVDVPATRRRFNAVSVKFKIICCQDPARWSGFSLFTQTVTQNTFCGPHTDLPIFFRNSITSLLLYPYLKYFKDKQKALIFASRESFKQHAVWQLQNKF